MQPAGRELSLHSRHDACQAGSDGGQGSRQQCLMPAPHVASWQLVLWDRQADRQTDGQKACVGSCSSAAGVERCIRVCVCITPQACVIVQAVQAHGHSTITCHTHTHTHGARFGIFRCASPLPQRILWGPVQQSPMCLNIPSGLTGHPPKQTPTAAAPAGLTGWQACGGPCGGQRWAEGSAKGRGSSETGCEGMLQPGRNTRNKQTAWSPPQCNREAPRRCVGRGVQCGCTPQPTCCCRPCAACRPVLALLPAPVLGCLGRWTSGQLLLLHLRLRLGGPARLVGRAQWCCRSTKSGTEGPWWHLAAHPA